MVRFVLCLAILLATGCSRSESFKVIEWDDAHGHHKYKSLSPVRDEKHRQEIIDRLKMMDEPDGVGRK